MHPVYILHPHQPYHMNMFIDLVGENGDTNQEQQKCLNTMLSSLTELLRLLLLIQVLQLIALMNESNIQLLQVRNNNILTLLCARLFLSFTLRQT